MSGGREALLEFVVVGDVVRVAAVDPETGVEVVVMGPAHAPRAELERLAVAKLERALSLREAEQGGPRPRPPRPGRLV